MMNTSDTIINSETMRNLTSLSINSNRNFLRGESRPTNHINYSERDTSHHLTYSRRKRLFSEMDVDAKGIEKGLSSLTITKKMKLNSDNAYIPKTCNLIQNSPKESNSDEINKNLNSKIDMDQEKHLVENYYSQKNKLLFQAMFGS
jgi:hypothetical protein